MIMCGIWRVLKIINMFLENAKRRKTTNGHVAQSLPYTSFLVAREANNIFKMSMQIEAKKE